MPRRRPTRTLNELYAKSTALNLSMQQFFVPTLRVLLEMAVDAENTSYAIRQASLRLSRQLSRRRDAPRR